MLEVASSNTRAASLVFPSTQNLPPDLMSRGLPPDFSGRPQPLRSLKFHTLTYTFHLLMIIDVELDVNPSFEVTKHQPFQDG